jgi:predicted ArsR family transcriptional regulator
MSAEGTLRNNTTRGKMHVGAIAADLGIPADSSKGHLEK